MFHQAGKTKYYLYISIIRLISSECASIAKTNKINAMTMTHKSKL